MIKKVVSLLLIVLAMNSYAVPKSVIVYVWDGLRPDSVTPQNTPNLYALMKEGVAFTDNHSSYPTFTMMNASSFATGVFAGKTGFFGNILWQPQAKGTDAAGKTFDFEQPAYTEDYKILQDLDKETLILVRTLFQQAHAKGYKTAAVGKSGAAFFQDYKSQGVVVDEKHIYPLSFVKKIQQLGYPLPKLAPLAFNPGDLMLKASNGDPTSPQAINRLQDQYTPDPTDQHGSPFASANRYMMQIYLNEILPKEKPQLSFVWMRDPDSTEHMYGPGSFNYLMGLKNNDEMLGQLLAKLKGLGLQNSTDIIVVSDHAHSSVSAPVTEFPLRQVKQGKIAGLDVKGYSVSGEIRAADLLSQAGFHAYDGEICRLNPVMSGIKADRSALYPTRKDQTGSICGKPGIEYTTAARKVPAAQQLPTDAIIVAANGGSDYFYLPSHNPQLVQKLVTFLQSHTQFDSVFIDNNRYQSLPGTLPMSLVRIANKEGRSPDVIVGLGYDPVTKINNLPGIEFSDSPNYRGMHGTFSPIDVHNFLMANGPHFRKHFTDVLPSGNVDVAPTIANILQLPLANTDGRVLVEALSSRSATNTYHVHQMTVRPKTIAENLEIRNSLNDKIAAKTYTINLHTKILKVNQQDYVYFDSAQAIRK